jgi:pyruvate,water dikinase
LKSLEPSLELIHLAEFTRSLDSQSLAALSDADDTALRQLLCATEEGREVLNGVDRFLARHGYLSSNGSDFSAPSWAENPALIWRSIARSLSSGLGRQEQSAAAIRQAAEARVRASTGPMGRWAFGRLMEAATTAIDRRERASVLISEYNYQMRRLFQAAGKRLVEQGRLADVDSLFYLEYRELRNLAAGLLDPAHAAACISVRRASMVADAAIDPPETIVSVPGQVGRAIKRASYSDGEVYLSGIGGSPGLVRGLARVVHDPVDAPATLGRNDILVVPFSDVGWTPLFAGIGGIVAETGGQLSHTAIVAREYNLPAVVSVRDATRRICDGQVLTVDGSQGRVYLEPMAL